MKKIYKFIPIVIIVICLIFGLYLVNSRNINHEENVNEIKQEQVTYHFKNNELLENHFNKHGIEMGFLKKEEYEKAANEVINNKNSLHKKEKEDNDDVYYLEETNEFVVVSTDGYIRTYFKPNSGKKYYDKQ